MGNYDGEYSNLNDALNSCNANPQCKCIDLVRPVGNLYYTHTSGTPDAFWDYDAWVIRAICYFKS